MNRKIFKGLLPLILITNIYASALSEPTTYSKDLYKQSILDGNYDVTISRPDKFLDLIMAIVLLHPLKSQMQY